THPLGKIKCPLQSLHSAKTATSHSGKLVDAQIISEADLCLYPVFHCHNRKIRAVTLSDLGIDTRRAGGSMTTAQVVYPDYEKFLGIDRFARPDHIVPPASTLGVIVVKTCEMMVPG